MLKEKNFERRHYEALRRKALTPAVGRTGLRGLDAELHNLRRRRVEVTSGLAEALKPEQLRTVISTDWEFELRDGKLAADDGEEIEQMLERAYDNDLALANEDAFFANFLPHRSKCEFEELGEQEAMARGEVDFNTIVTLSAYSEEYDDGSPQASQKLIRAAQKPYWQRAMLRISHWDGNVLHIRNRSIDNSSVELLKETARRYFGYEFEANDSTSMLGERLHLNIEDDSWQTMPDEVVASADGILAERNDGVWKQGNKENDVRQAQAYVDSQVEIVDGILELDEQLAARYGTFEEYSEAFDEAMYDCIALLEKRLELGRTQDKVVDYQTASKGAGSWARSEGKSYDMCGHVIGNPAPATSTTADKTGFESLKRLENKAIKCPECEEKVVVPKKYLDKGQLHCSECGYHLDVCTGEKRRPRLNRIKQTARRISGLDIITQWWHKEKQKKDLQELIAQQEDETDDLARRRRQKIIDQYQQDLEEPKAGL